MSSKLKEIHVHEDFNDQQNMFAEKFSKSSESKYYRTPI